MITTLAFSRKRELRRATRPGSARPRMRARRSAGRAAARLAFRDAVATERARRRRVRWLPCGMPQIRPTPRSAPSSACPAHVRSVARPPGKPWRGAHARFGRRIGRALREAQDACAMLDAALEQRILSALRARSTR